jgi:hypothetical protein
MSCAESYLPCCVQGYELETGSGLAARTWEVSPGIRISVGKSCSDSCEEDFLLYSREQMNPPSSSYLEGVQTHSLTPLLKLSMYLGSMKRPWKLCPKLLLCYATVDISDDLHRLCIDLHWMLYPVRRNTKFCLWIVRSYWYLPDNGTLHCAYGLRGVISQKREHYIMRMDYVQFIPQKMEHFIVLTRSCTRFIQRL